MGKILSFLAVVVLVGGGAMLIAKNLPQASQTPTPSVTVEPVVAPIAASTTVSASTTAMPETGPMKYTLAQVAENKDAKSCWSTIDGGVYDLTQWITKHPGGKQAILKICGKDGTSIFRKQHGTAPTQQNILNGMKIGELSS